MISVKHLNKTYRSPVKTGNILRDFFNREHKTNTALHNISFEIPEGELVGFIGPNGAGKTTTMKILTGILHPTSGTVIANGYIPFEKKKEYLKQIAFVMGQKNQLIWELPATDTFLLNKEIYEVSDTQYKKTLATLVDLLEVSDILYRPVKTLSLGQRMRMELIASLIHNPDILFLDEPTIGLDIFAQETIITFIRQYQKETNATVILTSHYMQDVQRLAKRIIMIDRGEILYDGKLTNLIDTYSQTKKISIVLENETDMKNLQLPPDVIVAYQYPRLQLTMKKERIEKLLPIIVESISYVDLTIENEPLEDVVKKQYKKS